VKKVSHVSHLGQAVGLAAAGLLIAACVSPSLAAAPAASLTVRGSVKQVDVTGAGPGERLRLIDRHRHLVASRRAGSLGGVVFRNVNPGRGYRVRRAGGAVSRAVVVISGRPAPPSTRIYRQTIPSSGYGYLKVRDGTKLAIYVRLPGPADQGPYPTLIEYSGYGYADPAGAESGISSIANLLGFAVVDVNMRGTGCSGGAFDYFERLQSLDGYDLIETVARQPWALHHRVGMIGISYGGISQLFVAATNPPHLAAISPLSVIDNTSTTLYPGGILNTGFALAWAEQRVHDAKPASPTGGQAWALDRIQNGDLVCRANQALHTSAVNLIRKIHANRYYRPSVADRLAPVNFVHKIKAPVYLACQLNDEQTGAHCPDLAEHFTGTRRKWFTFTNGLHVDSLDPTSFNRWYDFLELYVAHRPPKLSASVKALAPAIYQAAMGIPGVTLPADPIQDEPSYQAALAAFNRQPPVRILFDNGAGGSTPGAPVPAFARSFARFPLPGTRARSWYLAPHGRLRSTVPRRAGHDSFTWDKAARPATNFTGDTGPGGLWSANPDYHWLQNPPGSAVSYVTAPLRTNTVIVGAGALRAWIRSSRRDVDLQVTISEVRPDGKETFVQTGWLRASERRLDPAKSTLLEPVPSFRRADAAPLPKRRFTKVTVPLYYQGHVYRAGSRIRIILAAPGGDQPVWSFGDTTPKGRARVSVAFSRAMPSRVILPVVPGIAVPTGLPPCPALRGEPCRQYQP
jgi:uncharacterized protein